METEGTDIEHRLLAQAERQTKALETLQSFALWWTVAAAIAVSLWLFVTFAR